MDSDDEFPCLKPSGIADKVKNIDGRMVNKDGSLSLPRQIPAVICHSPVESDDEGGDAKSKVGDEKVKTADPKVNTSYADAVAPEKLVKPRVNFRLLETDCPSVESAEVLIPLSSVAEANARFEFTLYGYFLGKRVAFPVVEQYVKNSWKKFGISNIMMNAKGFFFFKFNSVTGMEGALANGPWAIRGVPIILRKWTPNVALAKEDLASIPVWVKFHDVPIAAFTADGLSVIASNLGTPIMLDSYTSDMCMNSWGRLDFARALIDVRADRVPKDSLVIAIPSEMSQDVSLHTVKVEFEWKPPRCKSCMVFGHTIDQCPKNEKPEDKPKEAQKPWNDGQSKSGAFQPKPFRGLLVNNQKKVSLGKNKKAYVPKVQVKEASKTSTSNSFEALKNLNAEPSTSASKELHPQGEVKERGKEKIQDPSNLHDGNLQRKKAEGNQQWKKAEGYDSEDDEVLDPFDYDMTNYLDSHDRQGRKKR